MSSSLSPGAKLGRYEIRSQLGVGGMGEVYLAEDTQLHRKVAIKVLPVEVAANQDRMRRFTQEAQAAAALNHPNIAHIYEVGEHNGLNFIAMEFVDGQTLRECIQCGIDLRKLLLYLQNVAEGLAKAHALGIVHRESPETTRQVVVNGKQLRDDQINFLEQKYRSPIPDGYYWVRPYVWRVGNYWWTSTLHPGTESRYRWSIAARRLRRQHRRLYQWPGTPLPRSGAAPTRSADDYSRTLVVGRVRKFWQ